MKLTDYPVLQSTETETLANGSRDEVKQEVAGCITAPMILPR
jgi:hypothetical protein